MRKQKNEIPNIGESVSVNLVDTDKTSIEDFEVLSIKKHQSKGKKITTVYLLGKDFMGGKVTHTEAIGMQWVYTVKLGVKTYTGLCRIPSGQLLEYACDDKDSEKVRENQARRSRNGQYWTSTYLDEYKRQGITVLPTQTEERIKEYIERCGPYVYIPNSGALWSLCVGCKSNVLPFIALDLV